jgi:KDO2-lipid IV(A) lauroyltransferase
MNFLVYVIFIILEKLIPVFPLRFMYRIARLKSKFFYYFIPIRKKVAYKNLKFVFPEKNDYEIHEIIKNCYLNVFIVLIEFFYLPHLSKGQLEEKFRILNSEVMGSSFAAGKGIIFVSGHFGNWEIMAYGGAQIFSRPLCVIVKEQSNKKLDRRINKIREFRGNSMFEMRTAAREVMRALAQNKLVAFLGDQSAPAESVKVNFFGKEITAFEGPAVFALKTGAPVYFGVPVRDKNYNYSLEAIEIDYSDNKEYNDENIKMVTQKTMSLLEEKIRAHPEQWLWFHKRFKSAITYE